jgi:hypothetical protein
MTRHTTTSSRPCEWVQPRRDGGLSREWVHGPLQPMQDDLPRGEGRWLLLLLVAFAIVGTLAAAALP